MIIKCGYRQEDFCKYHQEPIGKVEKEQNVKCGETCRCAAEVFTDRDKVNLLYAAYSQANKEKTAYDAMLMRGVHGHCSEVKDDFCHVSYEGYTVWLVLHKKNRYVSRRDFWDAYECMRLMGMRIPKRICRKARRFKKNFQGYENYLDYLYGW